MSLFSYFLWKNEMTKNMIKFVAAHRLILKKRVVAAHVIFTHGWWHGSGRRKEASV